MRFATLTSRLLLPADRLVAALTDPSRRERTMLFVLAGYVASWTLYGAIAKASQDIHFDMAELVAWSREPALGYSKHPPFAAWLVRAWFAVFPPFDWAYYLLAMTVVGVALLIAWRLFARYLDGEKRVVALALLTLIPFYSFHALKFNPNTVLLPLWALTTLWFIRSFETRSYFAAAVAGVAAAASMLGKYWSIFLLAGLGMAALLDPRRKAYFRSAAPWITVAAGTVSLVPHVAWLLANDFAPFSYALTVHGARSFAVIAASSVGYLAGAAGYVALPVLLAIAATRPRRAAFADMLRPEMPSRQLAATAFWAPLLLPAAFAPFLGFEINSLWTMSAWTLLPVILLGAPLTNVSRAAAVRIVALAVALPLLFLAASPVIAILIHRAGVAPFAAHSQLLAERVARAWKEATDRPLRLVGGDAGLAYAAAFYLRDRPSVSVDPDPYVSRSADQGNLARTGIALVCPAADSLCVEKIQKRADTNGRRVDVDLTRSFFGVAGSPARYVIILVPPRQ